MDRREFLLAAAAAPFALRAGDAFAAEPAPVALVTCDAESRLALVDLRAHRVVGHLATPADPRSIERVGDAALVCHTAAGALSIVDRGRVRHVMHGVAEPRYTAAHPDETRAFVTDSGRSGVVEVDVVRGRILRRLALPGWARHLTISPDGSRLWVGLGSASQHVAVVETSPLRHVGTLTPGFLAHDVGHAPDGRLWITSGDAGVLSVDGRRQAADRAPQHVTFGEGRAYVTSGDSGTFHVQSLEGRIVARGDIPVGSYNVQYARGCIVTPSLSHGTLAVIGPDGARRAIVRVAGSCHDACIL